MLNTCNLSGACISEDRGLYVKGMYSAYIQDGMGERALRYFEVYENYYISEKNNVF